MGHLRHRHDGSRRDRAAGHRYRIHNVLGRDGRLRDGGAMNFHAKSGAPYCDQCGIEFKFFVDALIEKENELLRHVIEARRERDEARANVRIWRNLVNEKQAIINARDARIVTLLSEDAE